MHNQLQSPLFQLPSELRLLIYNFSLVSKDPIIEPLPNKGRHYKTTAHSTPPLGATLASTCRRISIELDLRLLYAHNTFTFTDPKLTTLFLASLPANHKDHLTHVTFDLRHCIDDDGDADPVAELELFEYLACPTMHFRTCGNEPCSLTSCSHLLFDLPSVTHIMLDARAAISRCVGRSEVNGMLAFLLRGTCAGSPDISTAQTCRPGLRVTLVPYGARRVDNCWTCRNGNVGEPWDPAWLCSGNTTVGCRMKYAKVGRGMAMGIDLGRWGRQSRVKGQEALRRRGWIEYPTEFDLLLD